MELLRAPLCTIIPVVHMRARATRAVNPAACINTNARQPAICKQMAALGSAPDQQQANTPKGVQPVSQTVAQSVCCMYNM